MEVDQVVLQWRAEEQAVRARLTAPGVAPAAQVFGRTGMEVLEAIFAGELPPPPMGDTLDFVPIHMAPGCAVFQGRPQRRHYNPLGTVHGGWLATLLDSAVGCAVHSTLDAGQGYTTLELKVAFHKAIRHDTGPSAEPYVEGALLAIRKVATLAPGVHRGLDAVLAL